MKQTTIILLALTFVMFSFNLIYASTLTDGLIKFYDYEEGSGDYAIERVYGYDNLTLFGTPTYTNGILGYGMNYSGSSDNHHVSNLSSTDDSLMLNLNDGSVGFWTYTYYISAGQDRPFCFRSNWYLFTNNDGSLYFFSTEGGTNFISMGFSGGDLGQWEYIVYVFDSVNDLMIMYKDGVNIENESIGSSTVFSGSSATRFTISGFTDDDLITLIDSWNGVLDNVMIYNRTLSGQEVLALYNDSYAMSYEQMLNYAGMEEPSGSITVTLNSPSDNFNTSESVVNFDCEATGNNITVQNITLVFIDTPYNFSNESETYSSDLKFAEGIYTWYCEARSSNNSAWVSEIRTLYVDFILPYDDFSNYSSYDDNSYDPTPSWNSYLFYDWINLSYMFDRNELTFAIPQSNYSQDDTMSSVNITYNVPDGVNMSRTLLFALIDTNNPENFTLNDCNLNLDGTLTIIVEDFKDNTQNNTQQFYFMCPSNVSGGIEGHQLIYFCQEQSNLCLNNNIYEIGLVFRNDSGDVIFYQESIPQEPISVVDNSLYKTFEGSGSGLAVFISYIAYALPIFIIPLLLVSLIAILVFSISKIIRNPFFKKK